MTSGLGRHGRTILALITLIIIGGFASGAWAAQDARPIPRMRGFHIDMNIAQFTAPYLKKELKLLADLGYDTIIWEVENNIRWNTCPECVSPEAFTKAEFKDILAYSRELGLEPVPLLQTLGHCEYVLKQGKYKPLAEVPERIDQYCPRNPDVVTFLRKWIDEYLELFGNVRYFHLGADEAYTLGQCPLCREYAEAHSLSALFVDHINAVSQTLLAKGIRPIIWGDMLLHYPEALDSLSRQVVVFDWLYTRYNGAGKVEVWGRGELGPDELDPPTLDRFGRYLYPLGDEPGRDPDPFYTADYLAAHGFDVVLCPSSSCWGDSVFAPRTYYHMRNTYDSFRRGLAGGLRGAVLTSWTVHLFPWELQRTSIELPKYMGGHPDGELTELESAYVREHFGLDDLSFFGAVGKLAKRGLFNYADDLGFFKDARPVPRRYIQGRLEEIADAGELDMELQACDQRLAEYRDGLALLETLAKNVLWGQDELKPWDLAARNLINRAEAARILLLHRRDGAKPELAAESVRVLGELQALRKETGTAIALEIKPTRTAEILHWMYDSMEAALTAAAGR